MIPTTRSGTSRPAIVAILVALISVAAWPAAAAADDQPIIRIDPPTQTVAPGQEFTVDLVQSYGAASTGAQVNVTYNPAFI